MEAAQITYTFDVIAAGISSAFDDAIKSGKLTEADAAIGAVKALKNLQAMLKPAFADAFGAYMEKLSDEPGKSESVEKKVEENPIS